MHAVLAFAFCGCVSTTTAQVTESVAAVNPEEDSRGDFYVKRSLLARKAFAGAVAKIATQTGRDADSLRGATIAGIDERFADGVYTISLDASWSPDLEKTAEAFLVSGAPESPIDGAFVEKNESELASWIGPKQIRDSDGRIRFLGIAAYGIGRNTAVSAQNTRKAQLDAQAMAVLPFLGKDGRLSDAKTTFREVFLRKSNHPLCPGRDMVVCGYELISLKLPQKPVTPVRGTETPEKTVESQAPVLDKPKQNGGAAVTEIPAAVIAATTNRTGEVQVRSGIVSGDGKNSGFIPVPQEVVDAATNRSSVVHVQFGIVSGDGEPDDNL